LPCREMSNDIHVVQQPSRVTVPTELPRLAIYEATAINGTVQQLKYPACARCLLVGGMTQVRTSACLFGPL
jgi:hypothetical protein